MVDFLVNALHLFFGSVAHIVTSPSLFALMAMGIIIGLVFGSIPGLTSTMAVALILPMTYGMDAVTGVSFLVALFVGGVSGGLLAAILLNIPGTPSSIATCFDGYPMTKKGLAGQALAVGIFASFVGGMTGNIILVFLAPKMADIAVGFSPFEYCSIGIFAITILATLTSGSFVKGILAGLFGIFFSFVGMAPVDGVERFTFGLPFLQGGFSLLPVLLGVFALSDIFKSFAQNTFREQAQLRVTNLGKTGIDWRDMRRQWKNFLRSSLMGTFIGILPGIGGSTASIMAYSEAKRASRTPEAFGTGITDGVVASESANNGMVGGALVTMITLGIPGDATTAILLGGLMIHGVQPGPLLMTTDPEIFYGVIAALFVSNVLFFVLEYGGIRMFIKVLAIPRYLLYPIILVMCVVGAFATNNILFDAVAMIAFGVFGFILDRYGFSIPCFIIGFILGPMIESNYQQAMMLSRGDLMPFATKPVSLIFLILAVLSLFFSIRRMRRSVAKT